MESNVLSAWGFGGLALGPAAVCSVVLSALVLVLPPGPAKAQSSGEPRPAATPLAAPPTARDAARQEAADERVAALLLSEAREELELGELRNARRRLEVLVTRFASTSVGPRARRLLEQLSLIDGTPMPPIPSATPAEPARAGDSAAGQLAATRAPGASLLESDFSASGGDRLFFADGSDDVGGRGRRVLREKANWLRRHPQVFVRIEGYADDSGSDGRNSALALRRAETVRDALVAAGVPATRMHITAFGREDRVATCAAPECAAQNRRTVLVLTDANGARLTPSPHAGGKQAAPAVTPGRDRPGQGVRRDR